MVHGFERHGGRKGIFQALVKLDDVNRQNGTRRLGRKRRSVRMMASIRGPARLAWMSGPRAAR
jgi:hypothetical protein